MIDGKTILITGCGSLAKALTGHFLLHHKPKKIILYSRDEYLQSRAIAILSDPRGILRFFIGDVRDKFRLDLAMMNVDIVVHTAAMKRVEACEYNPLEAVKTNVDGTQNVITSCVQHNVQKALFISTDKAVMPVNFYGCTKAVAEKLWMKANVYKEIFSAVRYGNVMDSRGSVLPKFREIAKNKGEFPITDKRMTRFLVHMDEAVGLIMTALNGEPKKIYVLNSPTAKMVDIAKALYGRAKIKEVGNRGNEKLHEMLVSEHDKDTVIIMDNGKRWGILNPKDDPFVLTSDKNNVSIATLREMLK
jgi:FlaA1/EpsC-like NDP-sugar epimerase